MSHNAAFKDTPLFDVEYVSNDTETVIIQ